MILIECCNTVKVSLSNGVNNKQGIRAGTYKLIGKTNGRKYWVSSPNNQAIWYNQELKMWAIGSFDDLGTTIRGIARSSLASQMPSNAHARPNQLVPSGGISIVTLIRASNIQASPAPIDKQMYQSFIDYYN